MRLLVVEDDPGVRRLVSIQLEQQPGLSVTGAGTVDDALVAVRHSAFDAVILDLSLPDGSGLEVLGALRQLGSSAHVIILSGAGSEIDRVRALDLGADDYVVKPFSTRELTARILAVRRRTDIGRDSRLQHGPIAVDLTAREVTVDGEPLTLTAKEFDLLAFLAARPRHAFSRDELLRSVWKSAADWQRESTVTEHVRRLRSKIEQDPLHPRLLQTVRGVGYRFDPPPASDARDPDDPDDPVEPDIDDPGDPVEPDPGDPGDPGGPDGDGPDIAVNPAGSNAPTDDPTRSTPAGGGATLVPEPETVAVGTVVLVDGRIVAADETSVEMAGLTSEAELAGRDMLEFIAPQSLIAVKARQEAATAGRPPRSQVMAVRRADGTEVFVEVTSTPADWNGRPASRVSIRPSTDPASSIRHLVTGVLGEVSDAVIVTDPRFHVRSWNNAAERLYGWSEHEVAGRHLSDVIPFVDDESVLASVAQGLEERGRWYGEAQQFARDGSLVVVRASLTLIRDAAGEPALVVSVNRPAGPPVPAGSPSPDARDEADIRRGIDRGEFDVHYQPLVALDDLHVMAVEALVRWNHPDRGLLEPDSFIDAAERSGLIVELGRIVLDQACRQTAEWRRTGLDLEVAVNLSSGQLADPGLYDDITATLAAAELDPHALTIEVTETALVEDVDLAAEALLRLTDLGIRVAIDDFGTGWASLTYLKQFPVHALKIDKIFVDGVDHDPQDAAITRSILSLGRELDLQVVAEGVETFAQQTALRELGCSVAQGYLYGAPTSATAVPTQWAKRL